MVLLVISLNNLQVISSISTKGIIKSKTSVLKIPRCFMMSKKDTGFSRGSWVGSLYQRFEAVCQEVDDIVSHDQIKKLENHVHLVGDNVLKLCSNVKDLIPSSFGVPVNNNFELEDGDEECPSFANAKQFPQQMDVIDTSKSFPSCRQVSVLHSEDNLEIPSFGDSFVINQDYASHSEKEKQSSEISEVIFTNSYFIDQTEEKQSPPDASEFTCHGCPLNNENSDSFTTKVDESLSSISKLAFPDDSPCERSTLSMLHNQNHEPGDNLLIDVSSSAGDDNLGSEFHQKEETVQDTVDEYSSGCEFLCRDEMVNDSIHENSPGSECHLKEEVLCDTIHKRSPGSEVQVNEDIVPGSEVQVEGDIVPGSEVQVKEDIVLDSLSKNCFDVPIDNAPSCLLASPVTSSDCETSTVRLTSSISSPLLDSSDHCDTEIHYTEGHTINNKVVEIGSASTSAPASQSSEQYSCILSPKQDIRDMEFTEVPLISHNNNGSLKLNRMEIPGKLELDGSCVFVKADSNHQVISSAVERYWLRKKKIRDPFSSRKKLEKEYKQLAIWYCDIDEEFNEYVSGKKLVPSTQKKHLSAQDLEEESEWEFL